MNIIVQGGCLAGYNLLNYCHDPSTYIRITILLEHWPYTGRILLLKHSTILEVSKATELYLHS
jgi:hypothetical protein